MGRRESTTEQSREVIAPPPLTHLVGRSKRARFRRGGIEFTSKWQAFPLSSIPPDKLAAIEAQDDEIETDRVTEADARARVDGKPIDDAAAQSRAELVQAIGARDRRIGELEAQLAELLQRLQGDRPPKIGGAPGSVPPLPTPGIAQVGPGLAPVAPPADERRPPPPLPDAK